MWDDVGFGALEPFGGPIETPTLKRLCDGGLKYTQFHTTAICSSTRAALLTGRNHTTVGMACIAEAASGFPGSNGHMPPETATIAEVLSERGYNTYAVGKWHVVAEDETNMASSRRNWPTGRGFERFYGYLGGETNQWYPDLVQDQQMVDQPADPPKDWAAGFGDDDYHLSRDLVNRAISMIADAKQIAPDRPFFMYFCPGAGHAPHHAPKEWIDKYKGRFDEGYEAIRPSILANQKKLGLVPEKTELSPINPLLGQKSVEGLPIADVDVVRPWDSLHEDEKAIMRRMAEVYAGFCSYTDHEIARLIDYLEQSGELDNTLIILLSDNGASGEGGPNGSVNENKIMNGVPDEMKDNLKYLDVLGSPATYNHYAIGWAFAFNTPNKMFKRHTWEGGSSDPMVVHWPAGIKAKGESRHQYTHVSDVVPTVYDALGIEPPEVVKGYAAVGPRGHELQVQLRRRQGEDTEAEPVLRDARNSCDLARRLEGQRGACGHPVGVGPLRGRPLGAVPRRRRPLRNARPRRQAPGAPQGARRLVALRSRAAFRAPARRPDRVGGADSRRDRRWCRRAIGTSTTRARSRCRKRSP